MDYYTYSHQTPTNNETPRNYDPRLAQPTLLSQVNAARKSSNDFEIKNLTNVLNTLQQASRNPLETMYQEWHDRTLLHHAPRSLLRDAAKQFSNEQLRNLNRIFSFPVLLKNIIQERNQLHFNTHSEKHEHFESLDDSALPDRRISYHIESLTPFTDPVQVFSHPESVTTPVYDVHLESAQQGHQMHYMNSSVNFRLWELERWNKEQQHLQKMHEIQSYFVNLRDDPFSLDPLAFAEPEDNFEDLKAELDLLFTSDEDSDMESITSDCTMCNEAFENGEACFIHGNLRVESAGAPDQKESVRNKRRHDLKWKERKELLETLESQEQQKPAQKRAKRTKTRMHLIEKKIAQVIDLTVEASGDLSIVSALRDAIGAMVNKTLSMVKSIAVAGKVLSQTAEFLKRLETFAEGVTEAFKAIFPSLIITLIDWTFSPPSKLSALLALVKMFERAFPDKFSNIMSNIATTILSKLSSPGSTDQGPEEEDDINPFRAINAGGEDENTILGKVTKTIIDLMSPVGCPLNVAYKFVRDTTKEIKNLKSSISETWKAFEWAQKLFSKITSWIYTTNLNAYTTPTKNRLGDFVASVAQVTLWNRKELNDPVNKEIARTLAKDAAIIRQCIFKGELEQLSPVQLRVLESSIMTLQRFISTYHTQFTEDAQALKQMPFWIYLAGPSGACKSSIMQAIAKYLARPANCPIKTKLFDPTHALHMANMDLEFDNRYCGNLIYGIDDIFQAKEAGVQAQKATSEALKMIKLISPTPIEIAHSVSESKGGMFDSPASLTTSNVLYPRSDVLQSVLALHRRRALTVWVTRKGSPDPRNLRFTIMPSAITRVDGKLVALRDDGVTKLKPLTDDDLFINGGLTVEQVIEEVSDPQLRNMGWTQFLKVCALSWNLQVRSGFIDKFSEPPADADISIEELAAVFDAKQASIHDAPEVEAYHSVDLHSDLGTSWGEALTRTVLSAGDEIEYNLDGAAEFISELPLLPATDRPINFKDKISSLVSAFTDFVSENWMFIALILQALAVVTSVIWAVSAEKKLAKSGYSSAAIDAFLAQMPQASRKRMAQAIGEVIRSDIESASSAYDPSAKKPAVKTAQVRATMRPRHELVKVVAAGNSTNTAATVANNLIHISCEGYGLQGIRIAGDSVMLPKHFLDRYSGKKECRVQFPNRAVSYFYVDFDAALVAPDADVAIINLIKGPHCKDIRHLFASPEELGSTAHGQFEALRLENGLVTITRCSGIRKDCYERLAEDGIQQGATLTKEEEEASYQKRLARMLRDPTSVSQEYVTIGDVEKGIPYRATADWIHVPQPAVSPFIKGQCGAPLISAKSGKIVGMYHGRTEANSYWVPVSTNYSSLAKTGYEPEDLLVQSEPIPVDDLDVISAGAIKTEEYRNFICRNTQFQKTIIHGTRQVQKQPSVLRATDKRLEENAGQDPLFRSFTEMYRPTHPIHPDTMSKASSLVDDRLATIPGAPILQKRILTEDEMLNGVPGEFEGVEMSTSLGIPYKNNTRKPGKTEVLEMVGNRRRWADTALSRRVQKDLKDAESALLAGRQPSMVISEQLKDECLKDAKIKNGRTRTFECFPVHIAFIIRKYFGAFVAAMQKRCVEEPISVGINVHNCNWKFLYERLKKFGGRVIAGDYKFWDKGMHGNNIITAVERINKWYGDSEENQKLRIAIALLMSYSNVVVEDLIYQVVQGMPSGVPITAVLNSLCNWIMLLCCIYDNLKQKGGLVHWKHENVEMALYGDDHVIALHPDLQKYLNFFDFQNYFGDLGIGYTDALKSGICKEYDDINDVSYLKRTFKKEGDYVKAPLERMSVENQTNWCRKGHSACGQIAEGFSTLVIEAHHHGKEYCDELLPQIKQATIKWCLENGAPIEPLEGDYETRDAQWKNDYYY